jgi:hypothetical protein
LAAGVRGEAGCGTFQSDKESQGVMSSVTVAASLAAAKRRCARARMLLLAPNPGAVDRCDLTDEESADAPRPSRLVRKVVLAS